MSKDNEQIEPRGEAPAAAQAAVTAAVERWLNDVVAPARAVIAATLPRASPEERAVMLARALEFLPGPVLAGASAQAAAPVAGQAEQKAEAPAPAGGMEPLRPDTGQNGDAVLSKALAALEWRPAKNGKGEWVFVLDRNGAVEDAFTHSPLRDFLERVRAAPAESGLILGGYRYRINERFLHRWPLRR
jgi:hypothetical protein